MRRILRSYLDMVRQEDIPAKMTPKQANQQFNECILGNFGSTLKTIAYRYTGIDYRNVMKVATKEEDEAAAKSRKLVQIFAHSKCFDIFKNIQINNRSLYGEQSRERFVTYKSRLSENVEMINKLNLLIQLKAVRDEVFIRVCLKRIETAKDTFIMNIELGLETFIPKVLA